MAAGGMVQKNRNINIRINEKLKARFELALRASGFDQTDFITARIIEFVERSEQTMKEDKENNEMGKK